MHPAEPVASGETRKLSLGGWLTKAKSSSAKVKWFLGSTRRYFTIDYESQIFFYSQCEAKRQISQPIGLHDLCVATLCPDNGCAFTLQTRSREFQLSADTPADAQHWVACLNAARDGATSQKQAGGDGSSECTTRSGSTSGASTPMQDDESWADHGPRGPVGGYPKLPTAREARKAAARKQVELGLAKAREMAAAPVVAAEPCLPFEKQDPFAALDALEALAGPVAEQSCSADQLRSELSVSLLREARALVTTGARPPAPADDAANAAPAATHESTARAVSDAVLRHNLEADAWDSSDDEDELAPHAQPTRNNASALSATTQHNPNASMWDSDDDDENDDVDAVETSPSLAVDVLTATVDAEAPRAPRPRKLEVLAVCADESQAERKARRAAKREARQEAAETPAEREIRREARRERRAKKPATSADEGSGADAVAAWVA